MFQFSYEAAHGPESKVILPHNMVHTQCWGSCGDLSRPAPPPTEKNHIIKYLFYVPCTVFPRPFFPACYVLHFQMCNLRLLFHKTKMSHQLQEQAAFFPLIPQLYNGRTVKQTFFFYFYSSCAMSRQCQRRRLAWSEVVAVLGQFWSSLSPCPPTPHLQGSIRVFLPHGSLQTE